LGFPGIRNPHSVLDKIDRGAWKKIESDIEQSGNQALHRELPSKPAINDSFAEGLAVHGNVIARSLEVNFSRSISMITGILSIC
jgi:hypothetical protein